jgi:isoquinoline 1-oxidoreductase alpha subunit
LRDLLDLKATKYGCGMALCGACSVLVDGELMRACSLPISAVANKEVSTLEGLSPEPELLHPVQQAWIDENVPQCGYCQSGFMMAAVKLLEEYPNPTDADIKANINNICRCGTQPRIIKAIKRAAILTQESKKQNHVD